MGLKIKLSGPELLGFFLKVINAFDEIMVVVAAYKAVKAAPTEANKDALIAAAGALVDAVD